MHFISKPIELKKANEFVSKYHRHCDPVYRDKWRLCAVRTDTGEICGVIQAARPEARMLDDGLTICIVRCATDGTPNACSFLLGKARTIAKAMGYKKMVSYILETENGASYRAAGWEKVSDVKARCWDTPSRRRKHKEIEQKDKQRYEICL